MQINPAQSALSPVPTGAIPTDQLEQAFLEEMLKYFGPRADEGAFSGGHGEQQFASFLTREYAGILAEKLDLGLQIATNEARA